MFRYCGRVLVDSGAAIPICRNSPRPKSNDLALDFLNAQGGYRSVQLNYLNLVASYLAAASQVNLAVGREVSQ